MFKRLSVAFCFIFLVISAKLEAATILKLGIANFESSSELAREAIKIRNNVRKNLSESDMLTVFSLQKINVDENEKNYIKLISQLARNEDCQYILIGSVKRDRDIVLNVRIVDAETTKITHSMSLTTKLSKLDIDVKNFSNKILEELTGEYPKVTSVSGKNIYINRGSSSGFKKGNLYRVYSEQHYETIDRDGNPVEKNVVNLAIVEIKSVEKNYSVANLLKNAGETGILPYIVNERVELISKKDAQEMIRQKSFSREKINKQNEANSTNFSYSTENIVPVQLTEETLKRIQSAAENGHTDSQYLLGNMYMSQRNFPMALRKNA